MSYKRSGAAAQQRGRTRRKKRRRKGKGSLGGDPTREVQSIDCITDVKGWPAGTNGDRHAACGQITQCGNVTSTDLVLRIEERPIEIEGDRTVRVCARSRRANVCFRRRHLGMLLHTAPQPLQRQQEGHPRFVRLLSINRLDFVD